MKHDSCVCPQNATFRKNEKTLESDVGDEGSQWETKVYIPGQGGEGQASPYSVKTSGAEKPVSPFKDTFLGGKKKKGWEQKKKKKGNERRDDPRKERVFSIQKNADSGKPIKNERQRKRRPEGGAQFNYVSSRSRINRKLL